MAVARMANLKANPTDGTLANVDGRPPVTSLAFCKGAPASGHLRP
jgi:hypothetical protein